MFPSFNVVMLPSFRVVMFPFFVVMFPLFNVVMFPANAVDAKTTVSSEGQRIDWKRFIVFLLVLLVSKGDRVDWAVALESSPVGPIIK
jgi:hypothetical protein